MPIKNPDKNKFIVLQWKYQYVYFNARSQTHSARIAKKSMHARRACIFGALKHIDELKASTFVIDESTRQELRKQHSLLIKFENEFTIKVDEIPNYVNYS